VTVLPASLVAPLRDHLARVRGLWEDDRRTGQPAVEMPAALERKYPKAGQEWGWFWVFPARRLSRERPRRNQPDRPLRPRRSRKAISGVPG